MADLRMERDLDIPAAELWELLTTTGGLLQWWGPEAVTLEDYRLDFTRQGPWQSVMVNSDGKRHKVSGQVTQVGPGHALELSRAWHDAADRRGEESRVMFTVSALAQDRARLLLEHRELVSEAAVQDHAGGWTSSLRKLERLTVT